LGAVRAPEAAVDTIRREWEEGYRRLEAFAPEDPALYRRLADQIGIVTDELRRRVGEVFTLAELAEAYGNADRWSREALEERVGSSAHRYATLVGDAAFYFYARGASDYRP
jgi:hypothetical protein